MPIPQPTPKRIQFYLDRWDTLDNYVMQESALRKLLGKYLRQEGKEQFPENYGKRKARAK